MNINEPFIDFAFNPAGITEDPLGKASGTGTVSPGRASAV